MSFIIKGQAVGVQAHYVCVIEGLEYLTMNRVRAHRYTDLNEVLAAIPSLNLKKPFGRPDLTYSWESINDDFAANYVSSAGMLCPTCYARGEQDHTDDCPNLDKELTEGIGWPKANSGWSGLLALAVAGALAWLYVVMMMNRPLG